MFLHGHYGIMTVAPANLTERAQTVLLSPREVTDDWMMWPIFDPRRPPGNSSTQQKSAFPLRKRLRDWGRLVATTQTASRDFLWTGRTMRNYARDWRNLSITPLLLWIRSAKFPFYWVDIYARRHRRSCSPSSPPEHWTSPSASPLARTGQDGMLHQFADFSGRHDSTHCKNRGKQRSEHNRWWTRVCSVRNSCSFDTQRLK